MRIRILRSYIVAIVLVAFVVLPASHAAENVGKAYKPKVSKTDKSVKKDKPSATNPNEVKVKAYSRTKANKTKKDNYSTKGNINPHTGKKGTKNP
jgi:hypothetical protein